jgi:hypothetical protein
MSKTTVLLPFAISILAFFSPVPLVAADSPKAQFQSTTFDFGKVKQGDIVKHDYIFTNTGNAVLEILEVKPGCGCTTAGTWDRKVEPGKTGSIPLQFNSAGFGGSVSKSATVVCNDPERSNLLLVLSGTVWRPVDLVPAMAMFQFDNDNQTNQTKVVKITSNLDEPLTITEVTNSNKSFTTEIKPIKEGKEYELRITAVPPFTQPTTFSQISIKTSATQAQALTVTAYATVQMQVSVAPQQITLPAGPLTNAITQAFSVYYRGTNTLTLSDPKINLEGAEITIRTMQTGRVFAVQTKFPVGTKIKPGDGVQVTVKTDHPKHPLITVPIFQLQPPQAPLQGTAPAVTKPQQGTAHGLNPVPVSTASLPAPPAPPAPK